MEPSDDSHEPLQSPANHQDGTESVAPLVDPSEPSTTRFQTESAPMQPDNSQGRRLIYFGAGAIALVLLAGFAYLVFHKQPLKIVATSTTAQDKTSDAKSDSIAPTSDRLKIDITKNYGDTYKDGILPVGDKKYSSSGAKQGYVYTCEGYAKNLESQSGGGAGNAGPWFSDDKATYDINKKAHVSGNVTWTSIFSNTVSGSTRTIVTNDLPNHVTGVFPVQSGDFAYRYDRNPNSISAQNFTYALPSSPSYGSPNCMGGQVGIMLTGVALFSGFDADGRDAGAWEVQDGCNGHPEKSGTYHYHTLSSCIKDTSVQNVIGFALDGFAITGPKVGEGNVLTTSDLDECHGITSKITLDNKHVTQYHYVMTEDFPYSLSCFRGKAIEVPGSPQANQQSPGGQTPPHP